MEKVALLVLVLFLAFCLFCTNLFYFTLWSPETNNFLFVLITGDKNTVQSVPVSHLAGGKFIKVFLKLLILKLVCCEVNISIMAFIKSEAVQGNDCILFTFFHSHVLAIRRYGKEKINEHVRGYCVTPKAFSKWCKIGTSKEKYFRITGIYPPLKYFLSAAKKKTGRSVLYFF